MFCHGAAKEVQLIGIRHCDEQIRPVDPGLDLHTEACSVSDNTHHIIESRGNADLIRIFIN